MSRSIRRRRLEAKTDYRARIDLLKSDKPRLVIRKTNRYIIMQLVETKDAQDKVLLSVISKDLLQKGWPKDKAGSLKSKPAAYLTGYLLAKKASTKIQEAILDLGLNRNVKKARIYSALKGAVDGGLKIPCGEDALPAEEDLEANEQLKNIIQKLKPKL